MLSLIVFSAVQIYASEANATASRIKNDALILKVGTYDTLITDYQDLFFWLDYRNPSDSNVVISDIGAKGYVPSFGLASKGDTLWIGSCPEYSLSVPSKSRFFILCPISIGNGIWEKFGGQSDVEYVARIAAEAEVNMHAGSVRVIRPTNADLHKFVYSTLRANNSGNNIDMGRVTQNRRKVCDEAIGTYNAIAKDSATDQLLIVAAKRLISQNICLSTKVWGAPAPQTIWAPNWPIIQSWGNCLAENGESDPKRSCLTVGKDMNKMVKGLAGLNKAIQTQTAPYRFLAASDTVYVAWSSWDPRVTSEVFR